MSWIEDFEHPTLGAFRVSGDVWVGRSDLSADFYDLAIMRPTSADAATPPASATQVLEDAKQKMASLKMWAVQAICAARRARLNWREGPPVDAWQILEARIDPHGALWLSLHEYDTDEYSNWLIRADMSAAPIVRRVPALPLTGEPAKAGSAV